MPLVRAQRLLNSIETGTTNAASLQALLADPGRYAELAVLLDIPQQARRAMVASTTREAIFSSSLACGLFFMSKNSIKAIADFPPAKDHFGTHSTVMATILSNSYATSLVLGSGDLMSAVKSSIPSMNAIAANSSARALIGVGLGTPTAAYNALKTSHVAVAKMMAAHAGLNPTLYNTTRDLWNGTDANVFTPLTNSKNAIRFGLYSSLVGLLKNNATSFVSTDSPNKFTNDNNLYFLPLSWGSNIYTNITLQGTNGLGTVSNTPNIPDATMSNNENTTFSKFLAIAEADQTVNMKAGRILGTVSMASSAGGIYGVIGLGTV